MSTAVVHKFPDSARPRIPNSACSQDPKQRLFRRPQTALAHKTPDSTGPQDPKQRLFYSPVAA
eukprot:5441861-Pyramimonas_sp.AAC.1